jgi:hypothetical protein
MIRCPLYQQVLGAEYTQLPRAVQRFHCLSGHTVLHGWVETKAPDTALARILAICLGVPLNPSCGPLRFELTPKLAQETWTRHFPTHTMTSRMRFASGHIEEQLGPARLRFKLIATEERLSMQLVGMHFFGIPCPAWMLPRIVAEERGINDQLHFEIVATVPIAGTVANYRGHLVIPPGEHA